jgi:hypothetical protein
MPGPIPKHSSERRRRNAASQVDTVSALMAAVKPPETPEDLHPIAAGWFESLKTSGQSVFYEPSDWATAIVHAEVLSRLLSSSRLSAQGYAAWTSATQELLTTEGARRRVRLEIDRQAATKPAVPVSVLSDYRDAAGG